MFAEIKNNEIITWPYDYDNLIKDNPHTIFPQNLNLIDMYIGTEANLSGNKLVRVYEEQKPNYNQATQIITLDDKPKFINGNWILCWNIIEMNNEQKINHKIQKSNEIRKIRNKLLSETDKTQLPDAPLNSYQKSLWVEYRQKLRDLPTQVNFPWYIEWPIPPE